MGMLKNNKGESARGMALVITLLIIVMSAGILAAVMYYTTSGKEMTAIQRKYESSKEASLGGADIFTKEIIPKALTGSTLSAVTGTLTGSPSILPPGNITLGASNTCFSDKVNLLKSAWTHCAADPSPMDATSLPDLTLTLRSALGDNRDFLVRLKIVDTRQGNSDTAGSVGGAVLFTGAGVVSNTGSGGGGGGGSGAPIEHTPYLYTIVAEGRSTYGAANERADFEMLYAF